MASTHEMLLHVERGAKGTPHRATCAADGCRWKAFYIWGDEAEAMGSINASWDKHRKDLERRLAVAQKHPLPRSDRTTSKEVKVNQGRVGTTSRSTVVGWIATALTAALIFWGAVSCVGNGDDSDPPADEVQYSETECIALLGFARRSDITSVEKADALDVYNAKC